MWNQLALIEQCDVFCSPHTGFAFLAQFVGTPWLTIAGCPGRSICLTGCRSSQRCGLPQLPCERTPRQPLYAPLV
jgi:hypothetical protein